MAKSLHFQDIQEIAKITKLSSHNHPNKFGQNSALVITYQVEKNKFKKKRKESNVCTWRFLCSIRISTLCLALFKATKSDEEDF